MRSDRAAVFLITIAGNIIPLVIFFISGIDVHTLLIAYWIEIGIVGVATVAKIRRAEGTDNPEDLPGSEFEFSPLGRGESRTIRSMVGESKRTILRNFTGYYLCFWVFLGIIAFSLPEEVAGLERASPQIVLGAVVTLSTAHIVSYYIDFLGSHEYKQKGPVTLMAEPFPRLHGLLFTGYFGMFIHSGTGAPALLLLIIVGTKTYADVRAHRREHSDRSSERDE